MNMEMVQWAQFPDLIPMKIMRAKLKRNYPGL